MAVLKAYVMYAHGTWYDETLTYIYVLRVFQFLPKEFRASYQIGYSLPFLKNILCTLIPPIGCCSSDPWGDITFIYTKYISLPPLMMLHNQIWLLCSVVGVVFKRFPYGGASPSLIQSWFLFIRDASYQIWLHSVQPFMSSNLLNEKSWQTDAGRRATAACRTSMQSHAVR